MSRLPSAEDYAAEPIRFPPLTLVDVAAEGAAVTEDYKNQVLARVNASCLRLGVMTGEYPWHHHPDADELFLIVEGRLEIDLAGGPTLTLQPWQCVVVPAGTVHRTRARGRTVNLCFENVGASTVFDTVADEDPSR
jgi:mannose-6-phosphate isomerase-like protein (cupin superfamily)